MAKRISYPGKMARAYFLEYREARKWTQGELLERLDGIGVSMSIGSLSRYENGEQPYSQDVLYAMADVFGCEPEDLITVNPKAPDPPRLVWDALKKPALKSRTKCGAWCAKCYKRQDNMGSMSIWHWIIALPIIAAIFVEILALIRLAKISGRSAWWVMVIIIPYFGVAWLLRDIANKLALKADTTKT